MRRDVPGLPSPYPLAGMLPAFMQEDQFLVQMMAGFDDVLAPVISVLDCLDAYHDPQLAPPDFVDWLAAWLGTTLDDHWDDPRRRQSVVTAAQLHRLRGTVPALRSLVELATGGQVEVFEPGGTWWSPTPTPDDYEAEAGMIHIRVTVDDSSAVRLYALDELVAAAKPAHLPHTIEVVQR
jgi:phage tail-like protein